jgi:hypothetical protein
MADFFCRLNAPRATFAQDMTPGEADLMARHAQGFSYDVFPMPRGIVR